MNDKSKVIIFIDDQIEPIADVHTPVVFDLDTRKLIDGQHMLKIVSKDPSGKEGIRIIPFVVRNGPAIAVEGIKENDLVDGVLPIMVNAYGKGDQKSFLIAGSETPQSIPSWVWIIIICFIGWAMYYLLRYSTLP
ncbi:cytochrome C [Sphingobacterium sp. SYP-B4668]|uniref:cytochrome C n=1 Tax=Sphingobacterium sp. SYP-B4668 TaxID=2996035 RepID=UPI0022DE24FD|nr:cytochrome C [Sphingobacterium sp. SYP-B4668]